MNCDLEQIAIKIKNAKRVAIFTHMRPDGDAFGSALALSHALDYLHVENEVCVESDIPSNLMFINGIDNVKKRPEKPYDLLVCVDCSDVARLGVLSDEFLTATRKKKETINIDHHISNTRFSTFNFVRDCSANCMNVAKLIEYLGVPFDKKLSDYLLIGLLTDSGNFSHDDVDEEAFMLASKLVSNGADIAKLSYQLFKRQSKARAKLFALTMSGMRYYLEDRLALIIITQENMKKCEADNGATEGFVDFPLNVDGVEVGCSLMEVKPKQYKVSLRGKTYADVNKIAGVFGGGGHVKASGCMLFGELEEVIDKLVYTVSQYLND